MSKLASHSHTSPWQVNTSEQEGKQRLEQNLSCDICIIGAGMAGLSLAYNLSKNADSKSVCILEAVEPGEGETGNTSAHLASAIDDRFYKLEELFGVQGSLLAAESHRVAVDAIEAIVQQEKIECDFERVDGYLLAAKPGDVNELRKEFEAAKRAGFHDVEWLDQVPMNLTHGGGCIRFPRQAQFHPLKFIRGLEKALHKNGGKIYSQSEVVELEEGEIVKVKLANGSVVHARSVVVACNSPFNNRFNIHTKQYPYRSYVMQFEVEPSSVVKGLYWDTLDPYHYVRFYQPNAHQCLLIVGGEDHKTGQDHDPESSFQKLEKWTRENFPNVGREVKRWSGQILEPVDSLAFIGLSPGSAHQNVFIVTGDSGNGLTHGMIAAILLDDLLHGKKNPWQQLYNPSRKNYHLESMGEFFKENLNVAFQYKDYVSPGDKSDEAEIPLGEGAVIRRGLKKLAVYRDHDNNFHRCSAVCPHLGGLVRWNSFEKTWDCPCHGSRFDIEGNVINGPSIQGLTIQHDKYPSRNGEK